MRKIIPALLLCVSISGCASTVKYAPFGEWTPTTKTLGPIAADSGKWPLALNTPPPEYTYYSALRDAAAKKYAVPASSVVLGEVSVSYMAEVVGTIRSWKASATAGQKAGSSGTQ